jgi:hypothetical protein
MCSSSPPFVPRTSVNLSAFSHRINEEAFLLFIPTKGLSSVTHRIMNMTDVTQILVALSAGAAPREKTEGTEYLVKRGPRLQPPRVPRVKPTAFPPRSLFILSQPRTTSSSQRSIKHFYSVPFPITEGVDDAARQSSRDFVCYLVEYGVNSRQYSVLPRAHGRSASHFQPCQGADRSP